MRGRATILNAAASNATLSLQLVVRAPPLPRWYRVGVRPQPNTAVARLLLNGREPGGLRVGGVLPRHAVADHRLAHVDAIHAHLGDRPAVSVEPSPADLNRPLPHQLAQRLFCTVPVGLPLFRGVDPSQPDPSGCAVNRGNERSPSTTAVATASALPLWLSRATPRRASSWQPLAATASNHRSDSQAAATTHLSRRGTSPSITFAPPGQHPPGPPKQCRPPSRPRPAYRPATCARQGRLQPGQP